MANGKRFIAYEIVKRLKEKDANRILLQLREGLTPKQLEKGQQHQVFEESFDAKPIYHRQFLIQKVNYTFKSGKTEMEVMRSLGGLRA